MGRESRYYIPDNVLELVDDFPAWNTYLWGEYFWKTFYLRTLNVVSRKNKRDSKKNREIVKEPPKKKKKVDNSSKKKKKVEKEAPTKKITYNLYGFVWSLNKDRTVIPRGLAWSKIGKFQKGDYSRLFAQFSLVVVLRDVVGEVRAEVLELEQKITVVEKALKLRYQDNSEDFVAKQVHHKPHELVGSESNSAVYSQDKYSILQLVQLASNEKSGPVVDSTQLDVDNRIDWNVGFDHMLESVYINEQFDDKGEEGLVKLDDMLSMEENLSDVKVDEQMDAQVEVDRATGQASPPPTATEVEDEVCVDVHVDPV
ncbi:hypothetical protein Tco_0678227 [Tanacetum coccineum]|uniref:Uncharacterized protein n=1 Tax=Tanacetum coccineum TaxID=301880 RepID=A0ABQ4XFC5_9ASTR